MKIGKHPENVECGCRIVRHKRSFPEGVTLESELNRVMNTLASAGIKYPRGYRERLIRRYQKSGVRYPRILMRVGEPNIRRHNRYKEILEAKGNLLDYGCGPICGGQEISVPTVDLRRRLFWIRAPRIGQQAQGYEIHFQCVHSIESKRDLLWVHAGIREGSPDTRS
jgi:hypothetical protein